MIDSWSECVTQVKWRTKSGGKKQRGVRVRAQVHDSIAAHICDSGTCTTGTPPGGAPRSHRICIRPVARTHVMIQYIAKRRWITESLVWKFLLDKAILDEMSQKLVKNRHCLETQVSSHVVFFWLSFAKKYLLDLFWPADRNTLVGLFKGQKTLRSRLVRLCSLCLTSSESWAWFANRLFGEVCYIKGISWRREKIIFYVLSKVKYYAGRKRGNSYLLCSRLLKSNVIIITVTATMMMMLSTLTFLLSTLISSEASLWSYKGDSSPEFWSEHFPICGGDSQSPINLASDSPRKIHGLIIGRSLATNRKLKKSWNRIGILP